MFLMESSSQDFKELPEDFTINAFNHINKLCDFGVRRHDNPSGIETIGYLQEQFENIGLIVNIDTFNFTWVKLNNRSIIINGDSVIVQSILVNQKLQPKMIIGGDCIFLNDNYNLDQNINDKIVFSSKSNITLVLKKFYPKAVVILRDDDYRKLRPLENQIIELIIPGNAEEHFAVSHNLVASYSTYDDNKKDILITAHWDSENGPGADDNASGISLLIELSRYFNEYQKLLPYNLKFIAVGAEEMGLIGSKAYILKYTDEVVENCHLNFNIDAVAGGRKPYIEMHNPTNFKNYDNDEWIEIITYRNSNLNWYTSFLEVYRNSGSEAIYPDWLTQDIKQAMKQSNIKFYNASCCSGADHRSFAYLNIPVVYLSSIKDYEKNIHHTANDLPKEYFKNSLGVAGKTVQRILIEICVDNN